MTGYISILSYYFLGWLHHICLFWWYLQDFIPISAVVRFGVTVKHHQIIVIQTGGITFYTSTTLTKNQMRSVNQAKITNVIIHFCFLMLISQTKSLSSTRSIYCKKNYSGHFNLHFVYLYINLWDISFLHIYQVQQYNTKVNTTEYVSFCLHLLILVMKSEWIRLDTYKSTRCS